MKSTIFAYVCAPIRNNKRLALQQHEEYSEILCALGYIPIAPYAMFSGFLKESVPEQREARRSMSQEILRRCRVLVVCDDEITEEMEAEILLAKRLGIVATTLKGIKKISLYGKKDEDAE